VANSVIAIQAVRVAAARDIRSRMPMAPKHSRPTCAMSSVLLLILSSFTPITSLMPCSVALIQVYSPHLHPKRVPGDKGNCGKPVRDLLCRGIRVTIAKRCNMCCKGPFDQASIDSATRSGDENVSRKILADRCDKRYRKRTFA